jgi:uncharacterized repeat protein (TIGR02543 family)
MGFLLGNSNTKVLWGNSNVKMFKGGTQIYPIGNVVTYIVDTGTSYSEEKDNGANILNPVTFTPSKAGYTFVGWRKDNTPSADVLASATMGDGETTLYAVFCKDVTVTYYNATSKAAIATGKQYYNNGYVTNPKFTIEQLASPSWESRGWGTNSKADADVAYSDIIEREFADDITVYALYQRTITLSYSGNGANGSVDPQIGIRFWNSAGNYSNPTFILRNNDFDKPERAFAGWDLGGTIYTEGATVTLTANATIYATWQGIPFYWFQRLSSANGEYYEYAPGYPTEWTKTDVCCEDNASWDLRIEQPGVSCDNWDAHLGAKAEASAKGNKYATVYVTEHAWGNSTLTLNGTEFTGPGIHTVDVSDKLSMELFTHDGMTINYIYFHN